jgi:hypothetical protein
MSTRRKFLFDCSAALAAVSLTPLDVLAKPREFEMKERSLDELSFSTFVAQLKTRFRVYAAPTRVVELELAEATVQKEYPQQSSQPAPDADNEKFSLLFRGQRNEPLEQKMFKFEHDKIGRFDLFIVHILSRDTRYFYYEAVFNRPRRKTPAKR